MIAVKDCPQIARAISQMKVSSNYIRATIIEQNIENLEQLIYKQEFIHTASLLSNIEGYVNSIQAFLSRKQQTSL
ncbi:hypothetical protein [Nostoc sp. 106C]|uniref:hypothetical protein n=1 Tax=Nostoc sp. 106C TaxID=1932667 RepID=UPI000A3B3F52|nr:hypothetical protein [Nostoc sp. 106C]OUL34426.1 hypothetical protein BV375_04480 [Nostoc sp. 106C]